MKQLQRKILLHNISQISKIILGLSLFSLVFVALSHFVQAITLTSVSQSNGIPASWSLADYKLPDTISASSSLPDTSIIFHRQGVNNKYVYYGDGLSTGPAEITIPILITDTGRLDFSSDNTAQVFLNDHLVLNVNDVSLSGYFTVNSDQTISSGLIDSSGYIKPQFQNTNLALQAGQLAKIKIVTNHFPDSNLSITLTDFSLDTRVTSQLSDKIIGSQYVEYTASLTNHDTTTPVTLTHLASHLVDSGSAGFIPFNLSDNIIRYSTDPNSPNWRDLAISAPTTSLSGFQLEQPLTLNPGESIYFRYNIAPTKRQINYTNTLSFYFYSLDGSQRRHNIASSTTTTVSPASSPLRAIAQTQSYRVYFDSNGGSEVYTQVVPAGGKALVPFPPQLDIEDAPIFYGWRNTDTGQWYDFNTPVYDDVYLYADWGSGMPIGEEIFDFSCESYSDWSNIFGTEYDPSRDHASFFDFYFFWLQHNCTGQEIEEPEPLPPEPDDPDGPEIPPTPPNPDPDPEPQPDPDPEPPIPDNPDPEDPEPEDPIPEDPEDFIYDNPDDFLPVLGETLLVPDTGIITNLSAAPFGNETFATIIMSQPYILINLAVFAISFAVFFPTRKY